MIHTRRRMWSSACTHRGTIVEINPHVAFADLIVGVGECMPHPTAGFGGGYKIVMPGVCSYRSVADHHFAWIRHRYAKVNVMEGNPFYEEVVDAGRLARLAFKLDLVINDKKEIIRAFAGETMAEQKEAAKFAASLYFVPLAKVADVTITSAYPLEIAVQATKALQLWPDTALAREASLSGLHRKKRLALSCRWSRKRWQVPRQQPIFTGD